MILAYMIFPSVCFIFLDGKVTVKIPIRSDPTPRILKNAAPLRTNSEFIEIENIWTAPKPLTDNKMMSLHFKRTSVFPYFIYIILYICLQKGLFVFQRATLSDIHPLIRIGSDRSLKFRHFLFCFFFKF